MEDRVCFPAARALACDMYPSLPADEAWRRVEHARLPAGHAASSKHCSSYSAFQKFFLTMHAASRAQHVLRAAAQRSPAATLCYESAEDARTSLESSCIAPVMVADAPGNSSCAPRRWRF